MAGYAVNPPADGWSLTLTADQWRTLSRHFFEDGDEHGAVILADLADGLRGPRLLGRELILAVDGVDYVPGHRGYRALTAEFVRNAAVRARERGLAYIAVHNHFSAASVDFSPTDLASHERGYPALRRITGQIVAGLVLTQQAAAGDLWLPDGSRSDLAELVVPTGNLLRMRPGPATPAAAGSVYDRQARLFGDLGQEILGRMRVAVVGLGGVGSLITESLGRLGVGGLVLIDDELVEESNLPRLVAAELCDVGQPKTELAARNAKRANPGVQLTLVPKRVEHPSARSELERCDWIFLAADGHAARHWVNAAVHEYLIPATQVGVKIPIGEDGAVGQIHAVNRFLVPGRGCLWCNGLIDPTELAIDMHPETERRAAQYVPGVPAPSVIALNGLVAMEAVNHFMLCATGLHYDLDDTASAIYLPRRRRRAPQRLRQDPICPWCSAPDTSEKGRRTGG